MDQTNNQPAETTPAGPSKTNALALAGVVLGVVSVLTGLIFVGALFGLLAVVIGFMGIKRGANHKLSVASIFLGTFGILLTIIALIFGIKLFNNVKDNTAKSNFQTVREFNKGETGKFGNLSVSVTEVTRNFTPAKDEQKAEDGKELVVVSVSVTNNGKSAVSVEPDDFKLESNDGLSYGPGFADAPNAAFTSTNLEVGSKATGELVYKIKKDAKGLKLTEKGYDYNPATKRNEYVTFKITL